MNEQERHSLFTELITHHQSELYGYIYAVVRNWQDADDLFQSVCLVLWSKFESFQPGTSFFAWARQIAKIKISDFFRHNKSPRYVTEKLMDILTEVAAEPHDDVGEAYLAALRRCREKLSATDNELLQLRYVDELGTVEIADRLQRLRPSVSRSLNRIRHSLLQCIAVELARQAYPPRELL
jgi:RNA polymerase sigma-70 factor, ECF subfamily